MGVYLPRFYAEGGGGGGGGVVNLKRGQDGDCGLIW